jgi:hypothetical protein
MFLKNKRLIALLAIASVSQVACYNTYFIDKSQLEKLESEVEQKEVVVVYGDCSGPSPSSGSTAYKSLQLDGSTWAQAEGEAAAAAGDESATPKTASDATGTQAPQKTEKTGAGNGCERVPVSTANPVNVVTKSGEQFRVTPFNFMMSEQQIVSPEYDLLLSLDEVEGGEVRQFSTWKTVGTIVGVSAVAVGTFVGISVLAPEGESFQR